MKTLIMLLLTTFMLLPASAQPAPEGEIRLSYQNVGLSYDASLGTSVELASVHAVDPADDLPWWGLLPEHQQITLQDYPLNREFMRAQLKLFPVAAYEAIGGPMVASQIEQLRGLVAEDPALAEVDKLPYLPQANANQVFHAQEINVDFQDGSGIRYVTAYAQGVWPVSESELFYTFQGLSADGQYYVTATFPVRSNILPETPDGDSVAVEDIENYLNATVAQLNDLNLADFTPDLRLLDAMVSSILISDAGEPDANAPRRVTWAEAQTLLLSGQVTAVFQAHSLRVTLTLADGETVVTTEPEIDAIFAVLRDCGDPCADIIPATE